MAQRFLSNIKINDAYTFPASDGTSGQVISTDGAGNLSFIDVESEAGATVIYKDNFSGDDSTVTFTLANVVSDEVITQVYIDGVYQNKDTYITSGDQITFSSAPPNGVEIEIISFNTVSTQGIIAYNSKNSTGSTIAAGTAVMAVGTDGNSGHILIAPMIADGSVEPKYFMGITADEVANGEFVDVVHFGVVGKINTNSFTDGDVLWLDPANDGGFTVTEPNAPNIKIASAIVLNASTNGKIFVRVQGNEGLHELHDVHIENLADKDLLVYNTTQGYWENSKTLGDITTGNITTGGTVDGVDISDFKDAYDVHTHVENDITDFGNYITNVTHDTVNNKLVVTTRDAATFDVDLAQYIDDTNLARLTSGSLDAGTGIATFTRDDATTFTVDFSALFDDTDTNDFLTGASFNTADGVLTLNVSNQTDVTVDLDGRYLESYTETDTLATVTGRGATTTNTIQVGGLKTDLIQSSSQQSESFIDLDDDLWFAGSVTNVLTISSKSHMVFVNDTNSNGTTENFSFYTQGTTDASATKLFEIQQNGNIVVTGGISASGYNNSNWDTAYGWGDHSTAGYLTGYTETDTLATVTARGSSTTGGITVNGTITLPQNPVGTTYGNGVSAVPSYMIQQGAGDNDGIRLYAEAGVTNDVRFIFEVVDDIETGDTWVFRNKKTYTDYIANEVVKISGAGDITAKSARLSNRLYIDSTAPIIELKDTDSTGAGIVSYISYKDSGGSERGWVGYGSNGNSTFGIQNTIGDIKLYTNTDIIGSLSVNGGTAIDSSRTSLRLNSFTSGGGAGIFFRDGFTYNCSITAEDHNGSSADGICISGYDGVSISTGSNSRNERMRVTVDGDVGIGTTTPAGKVQIDGVGTANAATLKINNSSSATFNHSIEAFAANLTSGESNVILVGKQGNTKNSGYLGYYWEADGSNNNYVSLGHWAADHLFRVYGDQVLSTVTTRSNVDMRAPIFYDLNNTSYYVDPASTSQIRKTNIIASGSAWDAGLNLYSNNGSDRWNLLTDEGAANMLRFAYNNSEKFRLQTNGEVYTIGTGLAGSDYRAPVFYDSQDTNYRLDPASTSVLNGLTVGGSDVILGSRKSYGSISGSSGDWYPLLNVNDFNGPVFATVTTYAHSSFSIVCSGGYSPSNQPSLQVLSTTWNNNGGYANATGVRIRQDGWVEVKFEWSSGPSVSVRVQAYNSSGTPVTFASSLAATTATNAVKSTFGLTTTGAMQANYMWSNVDQRAPIFYDSDDTARYVNPSSQSNMGKILFLNTVDQGTPVGEALVGRNYAYNTLELKGYGAEMMIGSQSQDLHINYRYCNGVGNNTYTPQNWYWRAGTSSSYSNHYFGYVYGYQFYDISDTSRYVNPGGTSVLGSTDFKGTVSLSFNELRLVSLSDGNHYLKKIATGYSGVTIDGPQLQGHQGGELTTNLGGNNWALRWGVGGNVTINNSLSINKSSQYGEAVNLTYSGSNSSAMLIRNNTGATATAISFFYSSAPQGARGSITVSSTSTAYNTSSDYRLKENVVSMTGSLERVDQLKPARFNFIGDDKTVDGFLAHEAAEVVPEAVTGTKDEVDEEGNPVYQGIDQAKLVPLLVGAIQELKAEVEALKQQLNGTN